MKSFRGKLARELKWLLVSATIVGLTIGSIYSVAVLSQMKVEYNTARLEAVKVEHVQYTRWGK